MNFSTLVSPGIACLSLSPSLSLSLSLFFSLSLSLSHTHSLSQTGQIIILPKNDEMKNKYAGFHPTEIKIPPKFQLNGICQIVLTHL